MINYEKTPLIHWHPQVMEVISTEKKEHIPTLSAASQNGKTRLEPPETGLTRKPRNKVTKLCRKETVAVMPKVFSVDDDGSVDMEFPTNFFEQTMILLKRRFIQQSRNMVRWIFFNFSQGLIYVQDYPLDYAGTSHSISCFDRRDIFWSGQ